MNFIKLHITWWLTLLLAYLTSFLWLRELIICVPVVIYNAPLGLTSLFYPRKDFLGPVEIGLNTIFWSLFFVGAFGCKKLPIKLVSGIYVVVVVLLLLTLRGCALHPVVRPGSLSDTLTLKTKDHHRIGVSDLWMSL